MNEKWFLLGIDQIEKKLKTNAASGLSRKAARSRVNRNSGSVFCIAQKPLWRILADIVSDFALIILLLTAFFALFFEEYRSVLAVLVILVGNIFAAWLICYRSEKTAHTLSSFFYPTVRVVRNGRLFYVDFRSVVPGDVILIEKGDILCCDARLVTSEQLCVTMKLDQVREISLDKFAQGLVLPRTHLAQEMTNMVHAGSVVTQGSGRAIVTAVGRYTYIAAMTGGLSLPYANQTPCVLQRFRKYCSKINMIMLLAVLPFSLLSLWLSHIGGGSILLSTSFLTGLSLVSTTLSQLGCTLSNLFFVYQNRQLLQAPNAAVMRSAKVLEQLRQADYLFLLDGCAMTDGVLHFSSAVCADGEIRNYQNLQPNGAFFAELVSLYHTASSRMLTTGISGVGEYLTGMGEFIKKSGVDSGALEIRCTIDSYITGNLRSAPEQVRFHDRQISKLLQVSHSVSLIEQCKTAMIGGEEKPLSAEGQAVLKRLCVRAEQAHSVPLIFVISENDSTCDELCFAGMLILKEGIDPHTNRHLQAFEKMGCKVISFVGGENMNSPKIPIHILETPVISKNEFLKRNLPLTHRLGQISCYADFAKEDIALLIDEIHRRKQKVLLVGWNELSQDLFKRADGFVTGSVFRHHSGGYFNMEIQVSETEGQPYGMSCMQTVKQQADCLISRPANGKGGLASLVTAIHSAKRAYRNFFDFIRYVVAVSIIRIPIVAIPMLFGKSFLDARHVVFFGFLMDLFAWIMFVRRKDSNHVRCEKNHSSAWQIKHVFAVNSPMVISALAASISALVFPELLGILSFAGLYHDKTEFSFVALILLHISVFLLVYSAGNFRNLWKNKLFWIEVAFLILFLLFCFIWIPFGAFFGIETVPPIPYLLFAFLPSIVYVAMMLLLSARKKIRK